jgi:hypothetical protein
MSSEQSFQANDKLYFDQQRNRVRMDELRENAIYTAIARIKDRDATDMSVTFPVLVESLSHVDEPQFENSLGALAISIVLLDEDFRRKKMLPFEAVVHDDVWQVYTPIPIAESGTTAAYIGYFLRAMPDDPEISKFVDNDGKQTLNP